jgi:addiction module HigA family antidote
MTATAHHPGEVLAHKLEALGVTPTELARQLHVPANRITQIVNGKRAITGDSALRLAHWFGNAPQFWMTLQARYDLEIAKTETGREIDELPTHPRRDVRPGKRQTKQADGRAS